MNPWTAVGDLILGLWKSHKAEKWFKAWMSVILSAILTFLFTWGTSIGAIYTASVKLMDSRSAAVTALILGFSAALIATSGAVLVIVRKVPQFKEIALFFPAAIEEAIEKIKVNYGTEFDPNRQIDR